MRETATGNDCDETVFFLLLQFHVFIYFKRIKLYLQVPQNNTTIQETIVFAFSYYEMKKATQLMKIIL